MHVWMNVHDACLSVFYHCKWWTIYIILFLTDYPISRCHSSCNFFLPHIYFKQVRVLLDRAKAISKLWDDAPVVICGDFNCTPKVMFSIFSFCACICVKCCFNCYDVNGFLTLFQSPLYNFISEQKVYLWSSTLSSGFMIDAG